MSRAHLYRTVLSQGGGIVLGASILVCEPGTNTPVGQVIYSSETGDATLSNPFSADTGLIDCYLPNPQDVALQISYGGKTLLVDYVSVLPPASELLRGANPVYVNGQAANRAVLLGSDDHTAQWTDVSGLRSTTTMPAPSTPTFPKINGMSFLTWDGLSSTGDPLPSGFHHVEVQSVVSSVGTTVGYLLGKGSLLPGAAYGTTLQLIAVNEAGQAGPASLSVAYPAPA